MPPSQKAAAKSKPGGFLRGVMQAGVDAKFNQEIAALTQQQRPSPEPKSKKGKKKKKEKKDKGEKKAEKKRKSKKSKKKQRESTSSSSDDSSSSAAESTNSSEEEDAGFQVEAKEKMLPKGAKTTSDLDVRQLAAAVSAMICNYPCVTGVNLQEAGGELYDVRHEQMSKLNTKEKQKSAEPGDIEQRLTCSRQLTAAAIAWRRRLVAVLAAGPGGWANLGRRDQSMVRLFLCVCV